MSAVATGLDKREMEVVGLIMKDINLSSHTKFKDELTEWAIEAFQFYLAAGCDEREFIKRVPRLIGMLRVELAETAECCEHTAESARQDEKTLGQDLSRDIEEDMEHVEAANRLLKRISDAIVARRG